MKQTILLLTIFGLGVLLSRNFTFVLPEFFLPILLSALMLFIGLDIGKDKEQFRKLRQLTFYSLLIPVVVLLGSWIGAGFSSFFLPVSLKDSLLISSGLGYYSLSSVLISSQYSLYIGTIALLSNLLRETTTLILAPVLVKVFGKNSLISSAGATSMDVCLPVIQKYSGLDFIYPAFFSGFVLTISVPFLISFLLLDIIPN